VENERSKFDSVYSSKIRAGRRRTYFFDVKQTKGEDYYITLTESTKKYHGDGYERHKIFLYKEDFNRFIQGLEDVINHVKTELMPEYDYDEFTRRHEEYEQSLANQEAQKSENNNSLETASVKEESSPEADDSITSAPEPTSLESEEDMTW
jgi:hypothetical protein